MSVTTLTSKGQLTLPKTVREKLALKAGDRLRVTTDRRGNVLLSREAGPSADQLFGLLRHLAPTRPASISDMRAAVRRRAARAQEKSRT